MTNVEGKAGKIKHYIYLHLCILIFSMTEIFGKFAALSYKEQGIESFKLYIYLSMMKYGIVFLKNWVLFMAVWMMVGIGIILA